MVVAALLTGLPEPAPHDDSRSVGHPFTGRLQRGVRLDTRSPHYQMRPRTRARRWNYGVQGLVDGIRWTAAELAPAGAPLVVGNLSRRGGGDLPCSRSHNTGRDVDFGLFMVDGAGRSVPSRYYRFDARGRSIEAAGRYRFDTRRNWTLVSSLLTNPHFDVQWLILNPHLKRLLLEHAVAAGAPGALVERARRVIDLPAYANLHRNHLHVRILCPPSHSRCVEGGPVWPWVPRSAAAN